MRGEINLVIYLAVLLRLKPEARGFWVPLRKSATIYRSSLIYSEFGICRTIALIRHQVLRRASPNSV